MDNLDTIKRLLNRIYGEATGRRAFERIVPLVEKFPVQPSQKQVYFTQQDVVLITYGDSLKKPDQTPLATMHEFAAKHLKKAVSTIHFLPFFPYSSDDGFSVMDFFAIDPDLGSWKDVKAIGGDFELMFDYVLNHFSAKSQWFEYYLQDKEGFQNFAIEVDPETDLSGVTRPRSLPLLTAFNKSSGRTVHVWTTFSADQIDFNFKSLDVLEKMIEVLFYYVQQGATILRLDAIAYLWKEIGTNCIHLPQTHDMVKLFRSLLDVIAPDVMIITETNVPHEENISYFGNGHDEAQMVYNFTLPPLLFYSFIKQDTTALSRWAAGLHLESAHNTFFNFTASHDGIGVRPLEGILPPEEIESLVKVVTANNGQVSYKRNPDGSESPYELNITYVDAILGDFKSDNAERFLASQAIQYVLPGVPATYIHSLLGSRNWIEGVHQTGRARTINRAKLVLPDLLTQLNDPSSFRARVFYPYLKMIQVRRKQPAFDPKAGFEILEMDNRIFAIKRFSQNQTIYAVTNICGDSIPLALPEKDLPETMTDLIGAQQINPQSFVLEPYQYVWLAAKA
jgi:sucrose phosphorylase